MPLHPKAPFFARNGFFQDLESFQELESRISNIQEDKEKGDAFEVFTEAYLATQRRHEAKCIWPAGTAPLELLQKTGITTSDYGIDGLYQTTLGDLNAYQVKYRSNRPSLTWRELSTFIGLADSPNIKNRVLITNCDDFPDLLNQRGNFFCIRGADLDRLDKDAFKEIAEWLKGAVFEKTRKTPKPHQQEAIDKILTEFSSADRATAVMACGTGKTLVGLWVMEALIPAKAIILMPSLALIRQTLHEWLRETNIKQFSFLCVCSDQSVSEGIDSLVINQSDLDFEVTTDPKRIRAYLDTPYDGTKVVFTTYHSAPVVGESLKPEEQFDYGVFDEAHKTTGKKDRRTGFALSDENLAIKKRLFLTATPRRYNPLKRDEQGEAEQIFSMDDKALYGNACFTLSFGKAVDQEIICPYEVLISVITTEMITNAMLSHGEVNIAGDNVTALQVAHQIAVRDAVYKYKVRKIFTFHNTVKSAAVFTDKGPQGIKIHLPSCSTFHVNGEMASNHREKIMKAFNDADLAIMSNARCLTEGVDVPAVDMVAFLSPKKSQIDIIQAAGRAMRNATGKDKGYILVPLLVEQKKGESIESAVLRADYTEVWDVLQCLKEQDDVLEDIIKIYGLNIEAPKKALADAKVKRRINILAPDIALKDIEAAIVSTSLEQLTSVWDSFYGELQFYYRENMHCNAEYFLEGTKEDMKVIKWLEKQRGLYRKGELKQDRVEKLNKLGIIWSYKKHKLDDQWDEWERNFIQLTRYKRMHGSPYPQSGEIVTWLSEMLSLIKTHNLEDYKEALLRCIGVNPDDDRATSLTLLSKEKGTDWNTSYEKLKDWVGQSGKLDPADSDMPLELQKWVNNQKRKRSKLTSIQVKLLNQLAFPWESNVVQTPTQNAVPTPTHEPNSWDKMYADLKNWWDNHQNYLFSHMEQEVRVWSKEQCQKRRDGLLTEEQINLLNQINFPWNRY